MPFYIIRDDVTNLKVDAIVNAANTELREGGGVCGAIFEKAGREKLAKACELVSPIETGQAVVTPAFDLPAAFVIHTAGPRWQGGSQGEVELLKASYRNSLKLAEQHQLNRVAFPLISSGIYGFPKELAFQIARDTIEDFIETSELTVYLVLFDRQAVKISEDLKLDIERFIDEQAVHHIEKRFKRSVQETREESTISFNDLPNLESARRSTLDDLLNEVEEPFAEKLFRLIDESGLTDPEVYKKANLDRRLFSKIRSNPNYQPKKSTALALAIALELSLVETQELLGAAGFTLSKSTKMDLIVEYFIRESRYDIYTVNEVLFAYHQPLLGTF
ncbi:RNase III inhibitor [Tetzosporium hominis]|uniref:RNase III inhibitor n=1 Tax=Tetzosporium hominis TaxID=2020506 RepID=A0A264W426_9BACL|nr:macro domain-containing protein [Tetzosporium hominis]OZS78329.1 RNase III inhibitor [Tetzosporium hominis]